MLETALSTACSAICKTRGLTLSWSSRSCWSVKNSRQMRSVCAHSRDLKISRKAARSLLPTSSVAALTCRNFRFNKMLYWKEKWWNRSATNTVFVRRRSQQPAVLRIRICMFLDLLDPDPDPLVRYESGSNSGAGSFYHQAKIVRKTLIPTVLRILYHFLSLKNDVIVASKSNKEKNFFLVAVLKVSDENSRTRSRIRVRGTDPQIFNIGVPLTSACSTCQREKV